MLIQNMFNMMQMSDIVGGAIKDNFTKKNEKLITIIDKHRLILADGKYEKNQKQKSSIKRKGGAHTWDTPFMVYGTPNHFFVKENVGIRIIIFFFF